MEGMPWYQSKIIQAQIVSGLTALFALLGWSKIITIDIDQTVGLIFGGIGAIASIYTIITRIRKPAPNLSTAAANKEAELKATGEFSEVKPTSPRQGGFFRPLFAVLLAGIAIVAIALLSACAVNPHKTAQTAEQHGDAAYGELVILKEQGARVIQDASIADAVKRPIAEAIVEAKPVTDGLQDSLILYSSVKSAVAAGTSTQAQLEVVNRELAGWIAQAQPIISKLTAALAGVRK